MATIAGTIQLPNGEPYVGTIKFHRVDAPATVGAVLVTGIHDGLAVITEDTGQFATELKAGTYKMQIAGSCAWKIHVLKDDETYDITELGVPGFPFYPGTGGGGGVTVQTVVKVVQGVDALRARLQHEDKQVIHLEYLSFAGDAQGGQFVYYAGSMVPDDGVDVIRPNDVGEFVGGRWHRDPNLN